MSNDNEEESKYDSGIDYNKWPVIDNGDFELVGIDATKWELENGTFYTAMFNYYRPEDEKSDQNNGFSMMTQIDAQSLEELYEKINVLVDIGFFNGLLVSGHGTLWNEEGDELDTICWNSYCDDEEYSNENDSELMLDDGANVSMSLHDEHSEGQTDQAPEGIKVTNIGNKTLH